MLIAIYLVKLITAILAIKNNLKLVGYFLIGNLGLDIICQVVRHFNHYPKPYMGLGFLFFSITTLCYLANGAWLLFLAGRAVDNKTIQQTSILSLISILSFILLMYPDIAGAKLLTVFYAYYAAVSVTGLITCLVNIWKKPSAVTGILMMMSLGCLVEILVVIKFGFAYYWLVSVSNVIFYFTILTTCHLAPKYQNLMRP